MADNLARVHTDGIVQSPQTPWSIGSATEAQLRGRLRGDKAFLAGVLAISLLAVLPLVLILVFVIVRGASSINWQFLTELPKPMGEAGGGISNAIVGTILLIVVASVISIPLGILAGIFLSESGKSGLGRLTRLSVETLMGVPSIVIGIVAYVWVVRTTGHFSALSGGVALAMIMLPVITLATEETLLLIPVSLREAALALGVSYPRTVLKVILPAGASGVITGTLLAVARAAGETAPLLFTSFGSPYMEVNILKPMASLPQTIFFYATSPYPEWQSLAWGASFVLLVLVLALNLVTKLVTSRWKIQF
ncbi:MAG TPA: phosphate ABC transporter permease PstA [Spirochaetia bacterium]|nr:phosphate ABC transporter permease PstA [Spirochaetia bacterium]